METKKRRQKSCAQIARTRARQARRQKKHPIIIGWIFIAALLSIRTPVKLPATPHRSEANNEWPISDYERGYSTSPKPHRERYYEQPSMKRLMRDLRRPAAREDATQFLLARIDDVDLRGWVIEQIREGQINRLAIHVHESSTQNGILESWQIEMEGENRAIDAQTIQEGKQTEPRIGAVSLFHKC